MFGSKENVFNSKSLALWKREPDLYPTASNEQTRRVCSLLVRLACDHQLLTNTHLQAVAPESGEHSSMQTIDQFIWPNKFLTCMFQPVYWSPFVHFLVSIRCQRNELNLILNGKYLKTAISRPIGKQSKFWGHFVFPNF